MRAALVGWVAIALCFVACAAVGSSAAPAAVATAAPSRPSPSSSPSTSPSAAPTGPFGYDLADGQLLPGTYAAIRFRFPFTAEIGSDLGVRDAGDSDRFVYIGQDKNAPVDGDEEFDAMLLEQVVDPADQRSLDTFAGDAYHWFADHPRLEPVAGSERSLDVDGDPARQLDLRPADPAPCGSFHSNLDCVLIGYGPDGEEPFTVFDGSRLRIVVVDHGGTQVVFAYQATDDTRFARRAAVFDAWVDSVDFR